MKNTAHTVSMKPLRSSLLLGFLCICCALPALAGAAVRAPDFETSGWFVDMQRFSRGAHATLKCADCHGDMAQNGRPHPDFKSRNFLQTAATRAYDYSRCARCHPDAYQHGQLGAHAKALAIEKQLKAAVLDAAKPAPTCGDCHSAHYAPAKASRVTVGQQQIAVCGHCHADHTRSYLADIHGRLGVDLQNQAAAYCTDCHGAHTVAALDKKEDALPACLRCHPQAGPEFAGYVVHASVVAETEPDSDKRKALVWIQRTKIIAAVVVGLSLLFFLGHSTLWVLRELHEKLRKH